MPIAVRNKNMRTAIFDSAMIRPPVGKCHAVRNVICNIISKRWMF
jgi:hypothetical protein